MPALAQTLQEAGLTSTYETKKVAEGIWAFIAPESRSALVSGNSVAIAGDDGVLVVDSGMVPSLTRRMIAEIRSLTGKPVRYVVNTHWHWDHNFGNFVYRDQYPGVTIISTAFTRQSMADYDTRMFGGYKKGGTAFVENLRERVKSGKSSDGKPMGPEELVEQTELLHDAERIMPEVQAGRIELPDQTFGDAVTVYLGKREVQVRFLGRGNTAGDAVVYVPDAKVLITGDLLVGPIPFATGCYLADWIGVMNRLDAMEANAIVPGHGPVEHDKKHLELIRDLLQKVLTEVQEAVKQGLTLEETRKRLDLSSYRERLTSGVPSRIRNFLEYFERPMVETAYKQLKGQPTTESPFGD